MISYAFAQQNSDLEHGNNILDDPTIWVAVSFVLFVIILAKPAWSFITSALDKKIHEITNKINDATSLREEAQDMLAESKRKLVDAEKEAEAIILEAKKEANILKEKLVLEMEEGLKRREKLANDRISQSESDAVETIRLLTADLALEATQVLLKDMVNDQEKATLIDKAINELPKKLN